MTGAASTWPAARWWPLPKLADQLAHAGQEVGDVILYLLLLCSELGLDMEQVVRAKLADSERRFAR